VRKDGTGQTEAEKSSGTARSGSPNRSASPRHFPGVFDTSAGICGHAHGEDRQSRCDESLIGTRSSYAAFVVNGKRTAARLHRVKRCQ
jgi:hypothetical protein